MLKMIKDRFVNDFWRLESVDEVSRVRGRRHDLRSGVGEHNFGEIAFLHPRLACFASSDLLRFGEIEEEAGVHERAEFRMVQREEAVYDHDRFW